MALKNVLRDACNIIVIIFFLGLVFGACNTPKGQKGTDAVMKGEKGFVALFDGESLSGWHTYKMDQPLSGWKVVDGTIYCDPEDTKGRGDLVSDQKFKDFELRLEWKISRRGNSGVMFGVRELPEYNKAWNTGPEMQVIDKIYLDSLGKAIGLDVPKHQAGALYDLIPADATFAKPAEEWNNIVIRRKDNQLTYWLNGHKIVEAKIHSEEWNKMVAESKFNEFSGFAAFDEGSIAFQDYKNEVWYRNIRIKKMD